ncbi:hypothetical protein [Pontibacillus salipaludis]|uniref:Phage protein n=1 Tax=Pontibacillus salipaludis TaxID=1697394 RepID=A0ABQ1PIH7_9BACI|nr:hypothetical protein [Pontibacillus salipaludis]GGC97771.1 hypothetical protein GCM10011389_01130 [Pontibacillus salipaludis]
MSEQLNQQLKLFKKKHGIKTHSPKRNKMRKTEEFSENDIESLMGMNHPIYKRGRGGAYKQN